MSRWSPAASTTTRWRTNVLRSFVVQGNMRRGGKLADIEQRQGAAGDLLRTAVRIAIQRLQQARRVECGRGADRDRNVSSTGNEIGKHVTRQRNALTLGKRLDCAPCQNLRRRSHRHGVITLDRKTTWTAHAHFHGTASSRGCAYRYCPEPRALARKVSVCVAPAPTRTASAADTVMA